MENSKARLNNIEILIDNVIKIAKERQEKIQELTNELAEKNNSIDKKLLERGQKIHDLNNKLFAKLGKIEMLESTIDNAKDSMKKILNLSTETGKNAKKAKKRVENLEVELIRCKEALVISERKTEDLKVAYELIDDLKNQIEELKTKNAKKKRWWFFKRKGN